MLMRKVLDTAKSLWIAPIIISLLLCSCSNNEKNKKNTENPEPKQQQLGAETQGDEIPEQLESLENSIEKIILTLDGPAIELEKGKQQEKNRENEKKETDKEQGGQGKNQAEEKDGSTKEGNGGKQNEDSKDEGDKDKGGEKEGKESGGSNKEGTGQGNEPSATGMEEQKEDPWKEIDKTINILHYQWNSYTPLAAKKNAGSDLIDGFSTALNSLTDTIISKNKTNTLLAASYLYAYVPDFYSLYRTETSPEIKRVRYYTRNAMLNAMTANWEQADSDVKNLKTIWNMYKNIIPEEQKELSSQLDYSIQEFEKVLSDKNQSLCDIKGRVVMSNIQALEESMQ
ncbi:hypothetical protein EFD62_04805 [Acetivibrio mesophilus]|uniref:Uncharacterized protein n=2 Tax=Acetivibrio mesophilus TaxID=2487273 RepID=A0A4V1K2F2_9FIRM|nr:hypothetical protein A7W90_01130 [Clostridium sp. Bc-iso-3]RXE60079.1 hypothetical protein EFD62_04805 [Acetivibrio mesophilus]